MDILEEQKKQVEQQIYTTTELALKENKITPADVRAIGEFVLGELDDVEDPGDIKAMLEVLSKDWSIFNDLVTTEQGKTGRLEEQQAATVVATMVKQGRISKALATAKQFLGVKRK